MPAYFIAEIELTNSAEYEPYRTAVPATIAQYGGRFLTRSRRRHRTDRRRTGAETGSSSLSSPRPRRSSAGRTRRSTRKILPGRFDNSTGRAFIVEGAS